MDAFIVAFRIPNLVRDLFAEGAMSAAFVPAFTRHLTLHGKPAAWRLGNNVLNTLFLVTTPLVVAGLVFTRPLVTLVRGRLRECAGKARAHDPAHARHAAVPDDGRRRRRGDGHAELAASLFRPGALAGHVQRGDDRVRGPARPADAVARLAPHHGDCRSRAGRRVRTDPHPMAGARAARVFDTRPSSILATRRCATWCG